MKYVISFLLAAISLLASGVAPATDDAPAVSGDVVQQRLLEGNKRYVDGKMTHPGQTGGRRVEVAQGQHPIAAVLSCADSRVPPEVIFDQGLGDLFVVRLAGNIADDAAIGSLEYAVDHLGVRYIVVLGHERCGAVDATLKVHEAWVLNAPQPPPIPGHLGTVIRAIDAAVTGVKTHAGDPLENAVDANVRAVVQKLKSAAPILKEKVDAKSLTVVGARYDLDDGVVAILP